MHAIKFLHKTLSKALPDIHQKRLTAVMNGTQALIKGKILNLTQLGRHSGTKATERSNIRKIDLLLGNEHLHGELIQIYHWLSHFLLKDVPQAVINVDWSTTDKRKDFHILRASVAVKGRSITLYQTVHHYTELNNSECHKKFLTNLKRVVPKNCGAIIVTDAGFCNPWFKECEALGFDWIGRTKSTTLFWSAEKHCWNSCESLYADSGNKPKDIGKVILTKRNELPCRIITYKGEAKGRTHKTRGGKKCERTPSKRIGKRQSTPWVLVTSLNPKDFDAKRIVQLYKKRMQIEEDFRDTKSLRYGFSLRHCGSKSTKRIQVLLMIAALASLACWIFAVAEQISGHARDYQASSVRDKPVLSAVFLGCQILRRNIFLYMKQILHAIECLRLYITEAVV